jgi:hypothetical protein
VVSRGIQGLTIFPLSCISPGCWCRLITSIGAQRRAHLDLSCCSGDLSRPWSMWHVYKAALSCIRSSTMHVMNQARQVLGELLSY